MRHLQAPLPLVPRPIEGRSRLPIYELNRRDVQACSVASRVLAKLRLAPNRSASAIADAKSSRATEMTFDAWPFFHACKKTELAYNVSAREIVRQAQAFAEEHSDIPQWDLDTFSICDGGCDRYKDSSRTNLAARFGEGMANLFMYEQGYRYWDHIPSLVKRAIGAKLVHSHPEAVRRSKLIKRRWRERDTKSEPDFVFENERRESALMESKGSFVPPNRHDDDVAIRLKKALSQLEHWDQLISPRPNKSYAVASYFREASDSQGSFVAFVDPPGKSELPEASERRFPNDWIRRGNYGAWLIAMGFRTSGEALRRGRTKETSPVDLPILKLPEGAFAFTVEAILHDESSTSFSKWLATEATLRNEDWSHLWWLGSMWPLVASSAYQIVGIRVELLKKIQQALIEPNSLALMEVDSILNEQRSFTNRSTLTVTHDGGVEGSILPDGTLFAAVPFAHSQLRRISFRTFVL